MISTTDMHAEVGRAWGGIGKPKRHQPCLKDYKQPRNAQRKEIVAFREYQIGYP